MSGNKPKIITSTSKFLDEVNKIEDAIKHMETAVDAIERLQKNAINAAGSAEGKAVTTNLEETCFETNEIANMIRTRLKELEHSVNPEVKDVAMRRTQTSKLARNFMNVLSRYQKAQVAHEKATKERMKRQYLIANPDATDSEIKEALNADSGSTVFTQKLLNSQRHDEAQRALQEVQERHEQIIRLAKSIQELEQLFMDMQTMVEAQDQIVVNISNNVSETRTTTAKASDEIKEAVKQKKLSKKKCMYIGICVVTLIIIVVLVVYFSYFHPLAMKAAEKKIQQG